MKFMPTFKINSYLCTRTVTENEKRMITALFLFIAFCIRKRFVREGAHWSDKLIYYIMSAVLTPAVGPFVYKFIIESPAADPNEHGEVIGPLMFFD